MTILFTGKYGFDYNRAHILLEGLKQLPDVTIIEHPLEERSRHSGQALRRAAAGADAVYIPPFRHRDVRFVKRNTDKLVVFDPLISKYLTKVHDYGQTWKAPVQYLADKIAFSNCDLLLADTDQHKYFFAEKFGVPPGIIHTLPIGVHTGAFRPMENGQPKQHFHVGFYGSFVPLQGVGKIIETAHLLRDRTDIVFDIIGTGFEYEAIRQQAEAYGLCNVNFIGWVDYHALQDQLNAFDVCLGIFGDSLKAEVVIPNKVFHYAALRKCIISRDSTAIREIFQPDETILLTPPEPAAIARQILDLQADPARRERIAGNAYDLITRQYNEVEIARRFVEILRQALRP